MYFDELTEEVIHALGYCRRGCKGSPHIYPLDSKTRNQFKRVDGLLNRQLEKYQIEAMTYVVISLMKWQPSKEAHEENIAAIKRVLDSRLNKLK